MVKEKEIFISSDGGIVKRINTRFFYDLGAYIKPLTTIEPTTSNRVKIWLALSPVDAIVRSLLDFYSALTVCRHTGIELLNAIEEVEEWMQNTPSNKWEKQDYLVDRKFTNLIEKAKEFETVLCEELQTLAAYHVDKKGIYSIDDLINEAEKSLPALVLGKMEKRIVEEIRESGKCLAFDTATASAFHIMRATEAVLHKYYIHICKPESEDSLDNWGAYIAALYKLSEAPNTGKAIKEDVKRVIALLQQIKDQNRNLIMHPDVVLSPDEALTLFEIAKSSIIAMSDKLPKVRKK